MTSKSPYDKGAGLISMQYSVLDTGPRICRQPAVLTWFTRLRRAIRWWWTCFVWDIDGEELLR